MEAGQQKRIRPHDIRVAQRRLAARQNEIANERWRKEKRAIEKQYLDRKTNSLTSSSRRLSKPATQPSFLTDPGGVDQHRVEKVNGDPDKVAQKLVVVTTVPSSSPVRKGSKARKTKVRGKRVPKTTVAKKGIKKTANHGHSPQTAHSSSRDQIPRALPHPDPSPLTKEVESGPSLPVPITPAPLPPPDASVPLVISVALPVVQPDDESPTLVRRIQTEETLAPGCDSDDGSGRRVGDEGGDDKSRSGAGASAANANACDGDVGIEESPEYSASKAMVESEDGNSGADVNTGDRVCEWCVFDLLPCQGQSTRTKKNGQNENRNEMLKFLKEKLVEWPQIDKLLSCLELISNFYQRDEPAATALKVTLLS